MITMHIFCEKSVTVPGAATAKTSVSMEFKNCAPFTNSGLPRKDARSRAHLTPTKNPL